MQCLHGACLLASSPPRPDDPFSPNLRRPADVFLPSWSHGVPAALDFAVTSPQRQDIMGQAARETGAAAAAYEQWKRDFLNTDIECTQQGVCFVPVVAESTGGWGAEGVKTLRQLAKAAGGRSGRAPQGAFTELLQSLCVIIRGAKARAVLKRAGHVPCSLARGSGVQAAEEALLANSA